MRLQKTAFFLLTVVLIQIFYGSNGQRMAIDPNCIPLSDCTPIMVLYMSPSFWLLGVESRDFSQAEKERTACKAEQIHKMATIFTQNGPTLSF